MELKLSILCVDNDEEFCCCGVVAAACVVAVTFDLHVNYFCEVRCMGAFHGYSCEHGNIHLYGGLAVRFGQVVIWRHRIFD